MAVPMISKTGLLRRAKHPTENLQLVHDSRFKVNYTNSDWTYFEADNFTDPIILALKLTAGHDIRDVKFPPKERSRLFGGYIIRDFSEDTFYYNVSSE